ncbi:hypothetical protein MKX34_08340 [Paenibacillus sp. FSL R5-0636]|uniref:hypothetical protein n=1 Tax=Paenibacillus TaxID=44249 RepID=UPI00096C93CE|nr:hypothetical protein [Paenibacillus odorifer]OMC95741.1 hypothetical protein BJP49_13030 [Paenibacillus odorifer]OMD02777.1 hypothetical protein BJP46_15110 [Paenibacillus odorifer]OMD06620.1 hypothetical protein BJP47_13520 [Paenibacillus odorifer]OMD25017.1 hypothetical protein BJP48_24125 [Paenibacillus odorifer]OZQ68364.1 hypothetical protein CA596_25725 [Paenibacillus odorifer]
MGCRLSNGILTVDIADIGEYKGTRFDWTGFITQVTLEEGKHTFCVPESLKPGEGTGGKGLCNEFGISRAIGYDEAPIGGWFPKIGVGLLQKGNSPLYSFNEEFPLTSFSKDVEAGNDAVTYTIHPMESNGYAVQLTKTISLQGDQLIIAYELHNKGQKPFRTEEYIHNFIGIDGLNIGQDFELRLPRELKVVEPESSYTKELLEVSGNTLTWSKEPDKPFYCKLSGWEGQETEFTWELVHKPSGTGVRESGDFPIERMALWGEGHVVSPEVFVNISLLPRQSKSWRRSYRFFTAK